MHSLPSLPTGEGWIWSPEFLGIFERIKIRERETFHPDREQLGATFVMPQLEQSDIQQFIATFAEALQKDEKNPQPPPAVAKRRPRTMEHELIAVRNEYESQLLE